MVTDQKSPPPLRGSHDTKRREWLEAKGYRVVRFWNSDALRHCESVLSNILEVLAQPIPPSRSASRTDLPLKGGGGATGSRQP